VTQLSAFRWQPALSLSLHEQLGRRDSKLGCSKVTQLQELTSARVEALELADVDRSTTCLRVRVYTLQAGVIEGDVRIRTTRALIMKLQRLTDIDHATLRHVYTYPGAHLISACVHVPRWRREHGRRI
jgi:hypothetical protein